jgi:hypothetical protein
MVSLLALPPLSLLQRNKFTFSYSSSSLQQQVHFQQQENNQEIRDGNKAINTEYQLSLRQYITSKKQVTNTHLSLG